MGREPVNSAIHRPDRAATSRRRRPERPARRCQPGRRRRKPGRNWKAPSTQYTARRRCAARPAGHAKNRAFSGVTAAPPASSPAGSPPPATGPGSAGSGRPGCATRVWARGPLRQVRIVVVRAWSPRTCGSSAHGPRRGRPFGRGAGNPPAAPVVHPGHPHPDGDPMTPLVCPKCGSDMRAYERNGVTIDQCTGCRGIFLDRGELEKLTDAEAAFYGSRTARRRHRAGTPRTTVPRRELQEEEEAGRLPGRAVRLTSGAGVGGRLAREAVARSTRRAPGPAGSPPRPGGRDRDRRRCGSRPRSRPRTGRRHRRPGRRGHQTVVDPLGHQQRRRDASRTACSAPGGRGTRRCWGRPTRSAGPGPPT